MVAGVAGDAPDNPGGPSIARPVGSSLAASSEDWADKITVKDAG